MPQVPCSGLNVLLRLCCCNKPIIDDQRIYCMEMIQCWAISEFFIFSIIKNDFFAFLIKLITYFCTSPI